MRVLIIYDSAYGNTATIAKAIGKGLNHKAEVRVRTLKDLKPEDMLELDLVIVGSPTQGFKPTKPMSNFLDQIPQNDLKGIGVAAFDTRLCLKSVKSPILRLLIRIGGYAAKSIAKKLKDKGGELIAIPEGFLVKDKMGPLIDGEVERANKWLSGVV